MPVRVAVTGKAATPPLFETMAVLGKEICRRRLRHSVETLRAMKAPGGSGTHGGEDETP
jgi:glutamyl-tRNA synthetase